MRTRKPSPALVISIIALVMATTGSAVAAVNFAERAGAVDGLSAVPAGASNNRAAGRLVAAAKTGELRGRIPANHLELGRSFQAAFDVPDQGTGAAITLNETTGLGRLSISCNDENNSAGAENPATTVSFANTTPGAINFSRRTGVAASANVSLLQPNTQDTFNLSGSNTFDYLLNVGTKSVLIEGVIRQDGNGTSNAHCIVYGVVQVIGG
jgi:hypothetical protein